MWNTQFDPCYLAAREGVELPMMYGRGFGYGYDGMMDGYSWLGGLIMLVIGALVVAGIVLLVIWAVKASDGHGQTSVPPVPRGAAGHDEAVAIAKRRLAGGEITCEQYEEIMRSLGA